MSQIMIKFLNYKCSDYANLVKRDASMAKPREACSAEELFKTIVLLSKPGATGLLRLKYSAKISLSVASVNKQ